MSFLNFTYSHLSPVEICEIFDVRKFWRNIFFVRHPHVLFTPLIPIIDIPKYKNVYRYFVLLVLANLLINFAFLVTFASILPESFDTHLRINTISFNGGNIFN